MPNVEFFFAEEIFIHYDYLYRFILTATKDQSLAGDIVQETMARSWEKVHKLKGYSDKRLALRTIARNILYNYYKKKMHSEITLPNKIITEEPSTDKDGMKYLLMCEDRRAILKAIGRLKNAYMQVILLRYYYGQSFKDVAELTNMNYNTVLSNHRRAIRDLKLLLEREKIKTR